MKKLFTLLAVLGFTAAFSQTINIGPNQYAFQFTGDPDFGLFFNAATSRYEFRNGSANSIFGFSANDGSLTTNLKFSSGSDLLIGNNRYAFRASSNPNYGLFFSATSLEYQFLNNSGVPIFAIGANNGDIRTTGNSDLDGDVTVGANLIVAGETELNAPLSVAATAIITGDLFVSGTNTFSGETAMESTLSVTDNASFESDVNMNSSLFVGSEVLVAGGVRIGNSSITEPGNIRWTGADFEGYDGSNWESLTAVIPGPQGPQGVQGPIGATGAQGATGLLPSGSTDAVPYYNGSEWVVSGTGLQSNGTSVGIGAPPSSGSRITAVSPTSNTIAGRSVISAERLGPTSQQGTLFDWTPSQSESAIKGVSNAGNAYTAGVYGSTFLESNNSAAVLGTNELGSVFGGLAYQAPSGPKAGYFNGDVQTTGRSDVGGTSTVGGDFSVLGNTILNSDLEVIGDAVVDGVLNIGNSVSGIFEQGDIRWTSVDFEGFNGVSWISLTEGTPGPQGPQGIAGPAGILPAGNAAAVPYYDGSEWIVSGTGIQTNGTSFAVGAPLSFSSRINAQSLTPDAVGGRSVISARRQGLSNQQGTLTNWNSVNSESAIKGDQNWGNSYTAAVYGTTFLDFDNSAAILGTNNSGSIFGGLAYQAPGGEQKAGYFNGDIEVTGASDFNGDIEVTGTSDFGGRITVANSAFDDIGIELIGENNYYSSDQWSYGETNGAGLATIEDFVLRRNGVERFAFWQSYFEPLSDNSATLGRSFRRWSSIFATNGTINTSDAREKKNIKELDYGLKTLMLLKPVSFEWNDDVDNMGTKLGFVAQDLLEVVPEVVVTEEKVENRETGEITYQEAERMGVFYDDLIPVLTKAIQEQQGTIEELTEENEILQDHLKNVLDRMDLFEQDLQSCCFSTQGGSEAGTNNNSSEDAELGQNIPNPFSESTVIRYYLPDGTTSAIIRVTDMGGSPVKDLQLGAVRGANQVEFQTQSLAAGTYLYSLFVDGKFIDTKKMIIAR